MLKQTILHKYKCQYKIFSIFKSRLSVKSKNDIYNFFFQYLLIKSKQLQVKVFYE